jgi:hypothetical protein
MLNKTMPHKLLRTLYYDTSSPCAFSGATALYREAKKHGITFSQVERFLEQQDTYTRHKTARRKFPRNKTVAVGIDSDWQADLADMQRLSKVNNGYTFLLVCVDVFSKVAWVEPLINKTAKEVAAAFEHILEQGRKPWRLYTDKGKEFVGGPFQAMLKRHEIQFIQSESPDVKASVAENFIKLLKARLWRNFTKHNTLKYVEVLPKIMEGLNKRKHTTTKRRPVDVNHSNEEEVWETLYGKKNVPLKFKFQMRDKVRMLMKRDTFRQGYLQNFSKELFVIVERIRRNPPVYKVTDWNGEPVSGVFYGSELVKVYEGPDQIHEIEKIIKRRVRNSIKEMYVSWKGYPKKFNSWICESDLVSKV